MLLSSPVICESKRSLVRGSYIASQLVYRFDGTLFLGIADKPRVSVDLPSVNFHRQAASPLL